MAVNTVGTLNGKITYSIDKKSWNHLKQFQKQLKQTKRLMDGLRSANVGGINLRGNSGIGSGVGGSGRRSPRDVRRSMTDIRAEAVRRLSGESGSRSSASNTGFADMLRREQREAERAANTQRTARGAAARNAGGQGNHANLSAGRSALADMLRREEEQARRVGIAHQQANGIMDRTRINTDRYTNSTRELVRQGKLTQAFVDRMKSRVAGLNLQYQRGEMSLSRYRYEMSRVTRETRQAAAAHRTLFQRLTSIRSIAMGGVGFAAFGAARDVMTTGQTFEGLSATMIKASGNMTEAGKDMQWVSAQAMKMGVDIGFAADGFVKLAVAGKDPIGMDNVKQLFTGYSQYATSVGASKFKFDKGLAALGQMLNKGQVMAEELKGQLAEQIPGAMKVFADATGMTTKELFKAMENGELLAEDVLPLVGKQFSLAANEGGAYNKMLTTNRVKMGQLSNTFKLWKNAIFTGGFKGGLNYLFDTLKLILEVTKPLAYAFGTVLEGAMKGFLFPIRLVVAAFDDLMYILKDVMGLQFDTSLLRTTALIVSMVAGVNLLIKAVSALKAALGLAVIQRGLAMAATAIGGAVAAPIAATAALAYASYDSTKIAKEQGYTEMMIPEMGGFMETDPIDFNVNFKVDEDYVKGFVESSIEANNQATMDRVKEQYGD